MSALAFPLTLYVRIGCHLCEDMREQIAELLEPGSFTLTTVDIDEEPALVQRYNALVPVLEHDSQEICHHFLDLEALWRVKAGYNKRIGRK